VKINFNNLILLTLLAALTFTTLYRIPAADNWWNLATGRYIIENLNLPAKDIFSYTARGYTWLLTQWLTGVLYYLIYMVLGLQGLYLLRTLLILSTSTLIFATCRIRNSNPMISTIIIIIGCFFAQPYYYFDIRSYLVSYLFIALYIFLLEKRRIQKKSPPLWLFPFINCIWVNSHGAFLVGFGLIFAYFIDECFAGPEARKTSLYLLKTGIFMFLTSFINPQTYKILLYPFNLGGSYGFWQKFLIEWNHPDLLGRNLSFTIFWIICVAFILFTIKKATLRDIFIWILFSYLAFKAVRHITLFCLFIVPVFVKHLELILPDKIKVNFIGEIESFVNNKSYVKNLILIICLLIFLRTFFLIFTVDFSMEKEMFPYYAVQFIKKNNLPGRLYNPYEWGGYIIWKLYPQKEVFCDGRADMVYSEEICKESYYSMAGEDLSVFSKYNINIVLCNKINEIHGMNLPSVLQKKPEEWCLIYSDENSYIFIKEDSLNKTIIEQFYKGELKIPESPFGNYYAGTIILKKGNYKKALYFLNLAIRLDAKFIEALMTRGYILAVTGKIEESRECFLKVLSLKPDFPGAHYNLGLIYENSGNFDDAEREFMVELSINPYPPAKEALERLKNRK